MKIIKQHLWEIICGFGLSIVYLFLRLTSIMSLPLFTDEAIYTRWSQIARYDASWRFISLTDGKQPMFVWWDMVFMRFTHDPLLAGRLVSTVCGFLSVIGLFFLGREIFKNKWVGILTVLLYVFYPFGLVYDRMALYDSMVALFAIWSLYFAIRLVRNPKAWIAFTFALVLGGGMLTKTSDFFSWYLLPATLLLFDFSKKDRVKRFFIWVGFAALAVGLANIYYSILRLSPFFHIIGDKNQVFVYSLHDWLSHPLQFFLGNISGMWDWFSTYMTYPMILLILASLIIAINYTKEKLVLLIYFGAPFIALALFGKVLYPRFILFMTVMLLPLIALSLYEVFVGTKRIWIGMAVSIVFLALWIRADYYIITNFAISPIPKADLTQYSNDWPAGGGIAQIISYLSNQSRKGPIYVASEGTFGSLPTYAVEIYLGDDKNVEKGGMWPVPDIVPLSLIKTAAKEPVYMIFNQTQMPPTGWPVKLIARYQKGIGNTSISLWQVAP